MIEITKLTKRFGAHEVLRGVDLRIERGRVTGIIGPNGAGKTTLLKLLLGLSHPTSGELKIDGKLVGDVPHRPVRLFSVLVERFQPALILMHSAFVDLLDGAERVLPSLTPDALMDRAPAMRPVT